MSVDGEKVAVVTELMGTAGIELVLALEQSGFRVIANATEAELLEIGAGENVMAVSFDTAMESNVRERFGALNDLFGGIDVVVNNALAWADAPVDEITEAIWAEVIQKNLKATFYASRAAIPGLLARGGGRIINITSSAGLTGAHTAYAAACAGIMSLTRSLAVELAPAIHVNCIATGLMDEPWIEEAGPDFRASLVSKVPLKRLCTAADVAEFVCFLAQGGDFFTGQVFVLDGGEVCR